MAVDYTEPVINDLGLNILAPGGIGSYSPDAMRWDCNIGGYNFLYATNEQFPMQRQTAPFRRDRVDTEREPGEQSLDSGLWIRSQSSWHYGSGLATAEPLEVTDTEARFRYNQGGGVDPWTPGYVTLLNSTSSMLSASAGASAVFMLGVDSGVLCASGATVTYVSSAGASADVAWGGSGTITSITSDGENYYVADTTGIYSGALPSSAGAKLYDTGDVTLVRWVKSRLMATVGRGVYELTASGPSLPTALDPGTARPSGWVWTDMTEGPSAIYLSGYVGDTSTIERISVDTTVSAVTLDVPTVSAEMPRGERVSTLYAYVGSFLIVGTSEGCRVAAINTDGTLTLGPLVVTAGPVDDAVAVGNYVYVTVRDKGNAGDRVQRAGLFRIDLGRNINNNALDFAHAADLVAPAGTSGEARQVTVAGGRLWFAVSGSGVFRQDAAFVSEGWLETGLIRLGTMEKKAWRDLRMIAPNTLTGTITGKASVTGTSSPSSWDTILTLQGGTPDSFGKMNTAAPSPASDLYVAFKLTSDVNGAARLTGYQIRAVPAPRKTELIRLPVMMFDFETDRQGASYGAFGKAFERFSALKELEASGATVTFTDFTTGESKEVYVEEVTLQRMTAPSGGARKAAGGICTVLLRTV